MNPLTRLLGTAAIAAVVALVAVSVEATVITYSNKAAFLADTGATSATGALPNLGGATPDPSTVGSITFDGFAPSSIQLGTSLFVGGWSSLIPGNDLAVNSVENFDIIASAPVFAMGFDVHEPSGGGFGTDTCNVPTCTDSTFTLTFLNGAIPVALHVINFPNDVLAFVGAWSDQPFDRILVRETIGAIDDEFFGEVHTSRNRLSVVPEPASWALLGLGLLGLSLLSSIVRKSPPSIV